MRINLLQLLLFFVVCNGKGGDDDMMMHFGDDIVFRLDDSFLNNSTNTTWENNTKTISVESPTDTPVFEPSGSTHLELASDSVVFTFLALFFYNNLRQ